ncbi:hypothetical protein TRFO_37771 [Tritrichomonas foetus]|uniref:Uncharacterized protein n=1 Tax=Tritrichomonas foetus TaxID=1144522 RepID=A0A1J4JFW1_9EUKA|nr:hypothetical protein TRFO_37771 [Tritrichomonas foetus]|eukprot:OHS96100.1 hypothetical protein TRFO_37771 [Tritrichomonas foetus]
MIGFSKFSQHKMTTSRPPVGLAYPKGTYKVVPFFWRGEDPLRENEALLVEYRQTQKDYRKKESELRLMQQEFDKYKEQLDSFDKYAIQIANDLGENSIATTQNAQLRKEIKSIQDQIQEIENQIKICKYWTSQTQMQKLYLEDSGLWPEIETQMRNIDLTTDSIISLQKEIGETVISDRYQYSINAATEAKVAFQCKHWLNTKLQNLRNSMNQSKSCKNGVRLTAANTLIHSNDEVNRLFELNCQIKLEFEEVQLNKELATFHRRHTVKSAFQLIQELNDVIGLIGGKPIDLNRVRDHCDITEIENEEKLMVRAAQATPRKANDRPRTAPKSALAPKVKKRRF